jgi:hypothetical protein
LASAQFDGAERIVEYVSDKAFNVTYSDDGKTVVKREPIFAEFNYRKTNALGMAQKFTLSVPVITMIPIPSWSVDECTVEFLAKINSTETYDTKRDQALAVQSDSTTSETGTVEDEAGDERDFGSVSNGSVSVVNVYQDKSGSSVSKEYSMGVKVKAVSKDLPAGFDKILTILTNAIQDVADSAKGDQLLDLMKLGKNAALPTFS